MKTKFLLVILLLVATGSWWKASAAPIEFAEVSLLVRMHETDSYIQQQVTNRHLLHALSAAQEATLKSQGASDRLLASLRDPVTVLPETDALAFETQREQRKIELQKSEAAEAVATAQNNARALVPVAVVQPTAPGSQTDTSAGPGYYTDYPGLGAPGYARDYYRRNHLNRDGTPFGAPNAHPNVPGTVQSRPSTHGPVSPFVPAPNVTATVPTALSNNAVFTPSNR